MGSIGSGRALEGAPVAYVWPASDLQADFSKLVDQSIQGLLRPISKVAMVCQRLEVVQVVAILADWSSQRVASVVHNRGRSRARGRNPNAGTTQRRRSRAGSGWAPLFCDFSEAVTGCGASSVAAVVVGAVAVVVAVLFTGF